MNKEKSVDESWKEKASEEKVILSASGKPVSDEGREAEGSAPLQDPEDETQDIEINFLNYITSLGFQALIFMGEIPNPVTNQVDRNLAQSKFLIDTLAMLKEKTQGNLNDQEQSLIDATVYELQMKYVQSVNAGPDNNGEGS